MRRGTGDYPPDWPEFARRLKDDAGWLCVRCQHPHDPASGHILTVHHATMNKAEPFEHWWAFWVLCQKCHLSIQAKVYLDRPWLMVEHSAWAKPYVAGFFAWKYLGLDLSREEIDTDLEWFVGIERRHFERGQLPLEVASP